MKSVLITGCGGMLGSAVYPACVAAGYNVIATDLVPRPRLGLPMHKLDVRDYAAVRHEVVESDPTIILHLAAETDLEVCEQDPDHAYLTNTVGTQNVALVADAFGIPLVYISTAGIFDGTKDSPYTEFDRPAPINVYGGSKYEGERIVERLRRHFVIRAGWMIGGHERDHKFIAKVLRQIKDGATEIYAVTDKLGTPTYTEDFAANLLALMVTPYYGLYHMTCEGGGSRYDVAVEIVRLIGRRDVHVIPVTSERFSTEYFAPRPRSELMQNRMLTLRGMNMMRPWQEALRAYLSASSGRDR